MKRSLFSLLILTTSTVLSYAQPVLNNALNYSIGDSFSYYTCDTVNLPVVTTGPNQVWDYKGLFVVDSFITKIDNKAAGTQGSSVPNASFVELFIGVNAEVYPVNTNTTYSVAAEYQDNTLITYPDPKELLNRPVIYGGTFPVADDSFTTKYSTSVLNLEGGGHTITSSDGYGTLKLPDSTYANVMLLTQRYVQNDTIQQSPVSDSIVNIVGVAYYWFDTLNKAPLMRIDSVFAQTGFNSNTTMAVMYQKAFKKPTSISSVSLIDKHSYRCYTRNGLLKIYGDMQVGANYNISITNYSGQVVYSNNAQPQNEQLISLLFTTNIPSGTYIITLQKDSQVLSHIPHFIQ